MTGRLDRRFDWGPDEWEKAGRRALDLATTISTRWEERRPAPTASPEEVRRRFQEPLPRAGLSFDEVIERLEAAAELSTYIGHPRWLAYITSSPAPVGVLADLVTSAVNSNIALWRGGPAATAIELQSIDWLKELLGYPPEAEGIYSSGGQFANVVALSVMRDRMAGWDVRTAGTGSGPRSVSMLATSSITATSRPQSYWAWAGTPCGSSPPTKPTGCVSTRSGN